MVISCPSKSACRYTAMFAALELRSRQEMVGCDCFFLAFKLINALRAVCIADACLFYSCINLHVRVARGISTRILQAGRGNGVQAGVFQPKKPACDGLHRIKYPQFLTKSGRMPLRRHKVRQIQIHRCSRSHLEIASYLRYISHLPSWR